MPKKVEISHKTIIFTVLFLLSLWLLFLIKDIIFLIFIALMVSIVLNPVVGRLNSLKIPRALAVLLVYILVATFLSFSVGAIVSPLVEQTSNFAVNFPAYLSRLNIPDTIVDQVTKEVTSQIANISSQILKIGVSVFSNILSVFAVLVFALYFSTARYKLESQFAAFLTREQIDKLDKFLLKLEQRLVGWTRGQIVLMLAVGFVSYLGFKLLGLPYAVPLAVLAGLFEAVPNLGPVLAAVPAVIVGFAISPVKGLAVFSLAILVQQLENYLLVPKVMEKSAGVSPVITLTSLLIGFRIAGVVGAVVAVPVVIVLQIVLKEYL